MTAQDAPGRPTVPMVDTDATPTVLARPDGSDADERRATRLDPDPLHPPEWDRPEDDDDDSGMVIVWVAVAVVATIAVVAWVVTR